MSPIFGPTYHNVAMERFGEIHLLPSRGTWGKTEHGAKRNTGLTVISLLPLYQRFIYSGRLLLETSFAGVGDRVCQICGSLTTNA